MAEPFKDLAERVENLVIQGTRLPIGKQAQLLVHVIW
jgi:hypothetical protein